MKELDITEITPGPWGVSKTPNGQGGEYVSVVGSHRPCGESGCDIDHRWTVAWDIREADATAIVKAMGDSIRVKELENALRNVRALAMRIRRKDEVNGDHLIRFCKEVGIEGSILRETSDE